MRNKNAVYVGKPFKGLNKGMTGTASSLVSDSSKVYFRPHISLDFGKFMTGESTDELLCYILRLSDLYFPFKGVEL